MTPEEIKDFNDKLKKQGCYEQGIFSEPYGIPVSIKAPVLYQRYEVGGFSGGNCWGDSAEAFRVESPDDDWVALDAFLELRCPDISYLGYKKVMKLVRTNEDTCPEYYGNSRDYMVKYIVLKDLEDLLESFKG